MRIRLHFEIHIGRQELQYLPMIVATALAIVFAFNWPTRYAALVVVLVWLLTAVVIAGIDVGVTCWRDWHMEQLLIKSIDAHPAGSPVLTVEGNLTRGDVRRLKRLWIHKHARHAAA